MNFDGKLSEVTEITSSKILIVAVLSLYIGGYYTVFNWQ